MSTAAVTHGYRIDVIPGGTQLTEHASFVFGKIAPDIRSPDICHGIDHSARQRKGICAERLDLFLCCVKISDAMFRKTNLQNEGSAHFHPLVIVGIQCCINSSPIDSPLTQHGSKSEGSCRNGIKAESSGIGNHSGIKCFRSFLRDLKRTRLRKCGYQSAAALKAGIDNFGMTDLFKKQMVVDAHGFRCQRIAGIADKRRRGGIQNESKRPAVLFIRYLVHLRAGKKRKARRRIPDGKNTLSGEIRAKNML